MLKGMKDYFSMPAMKKDSSNCYYFYIQGGGVFLNAGRFY